MKNENQTGPISPASMFGLFNPDSLLIVIIGLICRRTHARGEIGVTDHIDLSGKGTITI